MIKSRWKKLCAVKQNNNNENPYSTQALVIK